MSADLYEVLGLDKKASPEDIRKAYKRRALQTHPDRLPPGTTSADKSNAEEQFRLVNNAYEVLNDPNNRELYDRHGVWPPPSVTLDPPRHRNEAADQWRSDHSSFFSPFGFGAQRPAFGFTSFGAHPSFAFTDPFEQFDSLFGDLRGHFDDYAFPSHFATRSPFDRPFGPSPSFGSPFDSMFGGPMGPMFSEPLIRRPGISSYSSTSQAIGQNGRWVSQSKMTRTINGRTETIHTRRDAEGNEHTTYSSPEGERHTINGVEQPRGDHAIQSADAPPPIQNTRAPQAIPAPPPVAADVYAPLQPQAIPVNEAAQTYASPPGPPPSFASLPAYSPPPPNDSGYPYSAAPIPPVVPPPVPRTSYDDRRERDKHHSYLHREPNRHSSDPYRDTHRDYRDGSRHSHRPREDDRHSSRGHSSSYVHGPSPASTSAPTPTHPREYERAPRQEKDEKRKWWHGGWLHNFGRFLKQSFRHHRVDS